MKKILISLIVLTLIACSDSTSRSTPRSISTPTSVLVRYVIKGSTRRGSMTWANAQGGTEQGEFNIPWEKSFTMEDGDFAYISAQNDQGFGEITCQIWVGSVKWRESTSTGAYSIVSCSGSIDRK